MHDHDARRELDRALDTIEDKVPDRVARALRWLRDPEARWVRIPVGILLIILSFLAFLPVIGIWFLPVGILMIAQDVPVLRRPAARAVFWMERKWAALRRWWRHRGR